MIETKPKPKRTPVEDLADKLRGMPPAEAMIEFERWFKEVDAELERRHEERIKEICRYERLSWGFVAFCVLSFIAQICLRFLMGDP